MAKPNQLLRSRQLAFNQQGGKCYYCGLPMVLSDQEGPKHLRCTAEHLLARSEGGSDAPSNIVAACFYCNHKRHQRKNPPEPERYRAEIRKRVQKGGWQPAQVLAWAQKAGSRVQGSSAAAKR